MASCNNNNKISLHKIKDTEYFWLDDPTELIKNDNYTKFMPKHEMTRTQQLNAISRLFIYFLIILLLFYRKEEYICIPIIGLILVIILQKINKIDKYGKNKEFDRIMEQRINKLIEDKIEETKEYTRDDKKEILDIQKDDFIKTKINFDKSNVSLFPNEGEYKVETGAYDIEGKLMIGPKQLLPKYKKNDNDPLFTIDEITEYNKNTCRKSTRMNPFMNPDITDYGVGDIPVACNANDEDVKNNITVNFNHELFRDVDELWERENSQRQFYTLPNTAVPNNQIEFAKWLYKVPETCKEDTVNCNRWEDLRWKRDNYKR
jgi:hypothetical protein